MKATGNLASSISVLVTGVVKIYVESGQSGGKEFEREPNQQILSEITDIHLTGSQVTRTFIRGKEVYATVCVNPNVLTNSVLNNSLVEKKDRVAISERLRDSLQDLENSP